MIFGKRTNQRGFTFVELVMSIVIIGIAVTGVLLVYTTTVTRSADPMIRQQALAIAEAYLEEIVSRHYTDPDGGVETRAGFDDIGDYDGLSDQPPQRYDGSTLGTALDAYTVDVEVEGPAAMNGITARRINVTVTHDSGISISLWSYRTDYP